MGMIADGIIDLLSSCPFLLSLPIEILLLSLPLPPCVSLSSSSSPGSWIGKPFGWSTTLKELLLSGIGTIN